MPTCGSDTAGNGPAGLRPDLGTRTQIHDLVVRFYREIVFDDLLGPVFEEVAEVDWSTHIPKLIDYWCRVLLGEPGYDGYILHAHQEVHEIESFRPELFDRWYLLFVEAIDAGWRGPIAERAKAHAARMAGVLSGRLLETEWTPPCARASTAG
jgi:hemoglobin